MNVINQYSEFLPLFEKNEATIAADNSLSMQVVLRDHRIPKEAKHAHYFWEGLSTLMFLGGPISIIFIPWYFGVAIFLISIVITQAEKKTCGQVVASTCMQNESLFNDCLKRSIIKVYRK